MPLSNITCINGLSCLEALRFSISWSIFLILPGVSVSEEIAGEGRLLGGKFK